MAEFQDLQEINGNFVKKSRIQRGIFSLQSKGQETKVNVCQGTKVGGKH